MGLFRHILVAFDGSEAGAAALRTGCGLSALCGAGLTVIHVPQLQTEVLIAGTVPLRFPVGEPEYSDACDSLSEQVAAIAREAGVEPPEVVFRVGDPASEILALADSREADLLVMGRRGMGDLAGLFVGSVTHKVQQLASCAVMTLR